MPAASDLIERIEAVQGFGRVGKENLAFETAVELQLVKDSGEPYELEELRTACAYEVNRRVEAGEFS